jgi:hypothetical protein
MEQKFGLDRLGTGSISSADGRLLLRVEDTGNPPTSSKRLVSRFIMRRQEGRYGREKAQRSFLRTLKDIYFAERQILSLPKMKAASRRN